MPLRSCALTNERSARGVNKEGGTCRLTRVASGLEERGESALLYTVCAGCRATVCVDCWEEIRRVVVRYAERTQRLAC